MLAPMSYRIAPFLLLLAAPLFSEKVHEWETAKVVSQELNSERAGAYAAPLGNGTVAVPLYRRSNSVVVETDKYIYQWQEAGRTPVILPVNGTVMFYHDGNWFIVVDSKNKKHKFGLVGAKQK